LSRPRNVFPPGALVLIHGVGHVWQGYAANFLNFLDPNRSAPFVMKRRDGTVGMPTDDDFEDLLEAEAVEILPPASTDKTDAVRNASEWCYDDLKDLDPVAKVRLAACTMCDAAGVPNGAKAIDIFLSAKWTAKHEADVGPRPKGETVRKWRRTRGHVHSRLPRHMVAMQGRMRLAPNVSDVAAEVRAKHVLLHFAKDMPYYAVHDGYEAEMNAINEGRSDLYPKPDVPHPVQSYWTIYRHCIRLKQRATEAERIGEAAAYQDYEGGGKALTARFAMQKVIIDHTEMDVYCVDPERRMVFGRPWLSLAVDVATGAIVGHLISFHEPSTWTISKLLLEVAKPKKPPADLAEQFPALRSMRGTIRLAIVDNGPELRSLSFESAAKGIGTSIRWVKKNHPRHKAKGERKLGTLNRYVCWRLRGRAIPIAESRRRDYNGEAEAFHVIDEVEAVTRHAIAHLNIRPNRLEGKRPPALLWEELAGQHGLVNPPNLRAFCIESMPVIPAATLTNSGIELWGMRYQGARAVQELLGDLLPLEGRRRRAGKQTATVKVKYDPLNIGSIWVWNVKTRQYVELRASDPEYCEGMPLAVHKQVLAQMKADGEAYIDPATLRATRNRLVEFVKALDPNASARARAAVAKLYEIPRIRALTGPIEHLDTSTAESAAMADFIPAQLQSLTALDTEILAPRKPWGGRPRPAVDDDDDDAPAPRPVGRSRRRHPQYE